MLEAGEKLFSCMWMQKNDYRAAGNQSDELLAKLIFIAEAFLLFSVVGGIRG